MAENSKIEWTDATWNVVTGCTKISAGCAHCYIESTPPFRIAGRKFVRGHIPLEFHPDRLGLPLTWKRPRRVFVNSLSDMFHHDVPDELIRKMFAVMSLCGQHTFQILTKRPERMAAWFADSENTLDACQAELTVADFDADRTPTGKSRVRDLRAINGTYGKKVGDGNHWPLPNVWLGTSVENQAAADERIPHLLRTPAAVRFLSCEPLLGPVSLLPYRDADGNVRISQGIDCDWVIIGGESGHGARPMQIEWVRSIVEQCRDVGVAVFVKQLGASVEASEAIDPIDQFPGNVTFRQGRDIHTALIKLIDRKGGDPEEWPADLRVREFPNVDQLPQSSA